MNEEGLREWFIDTGLMDSSVVITEGRYSSGMSLQASVLACYHLFYKKEHKPVPLKDVAESSRTEIRDYGGI